MLNLTNLMNMINLVTWPFVCPDKNSAIKAANTRFHFIIVGGGSAGSVLANRLTENRYINVLLLEAGDCPPITSYVPAASILNVGTNVDWSFLVKSQTNAFMSYPNNQPTYPQGKMLGGSSGLNAMMYIRGNREDYNNWKALGNEGWGFDDLFPYIYKSEGNTIPEQMKDESYHNTRGPLKVSFAPYSTKILDAFLKSAAYTGDYVADINAAYQLGVAQLPFTQNNGVRWSTYAAYLSPIMKTRSNLVVLTNAYVTKILTDSHKQAIGVEYRRNGVTYKAYSTLEVILSAGAFMSPKILLLSGIGPANQLQQHNIPVVVNLPGVGENLQDHVGCWGLAWKLTCKKCTWRIKNVLSLKSILQYSLMRKGPLTLWGGNEGVGFFRSKYVNSSSFKPDFQIQLASVNLVSILDIFLGLGGMSAEAVKQYYGPLRKGNAFMTIVNNHNVKSRGTVTLQSNNPFDPPVIDFKYFSDPMDIEILLEAIKKAISMVNTPPFQALGAQLNPTVLKGCEHFKQFSDEYYVCLIRHLSFIAYHPAGTCQMGPLTNPMSVVNSNLEVYGTSRLRVIDASIMPVLITGNPNAPTIMIAEKLSDVIKLKYRF